MTRFAINNICEFAFDTYASHILKTALQCVAGVKISEEIMKSKSSRLQAEKTKKGAENVYLESIDPNDIKTLKGAVCKVMESEQKEGKNILFTAINLVKYAVIILLF